MVKFFDGPARFGSLELRRTPVFLRVVIDVNGDLDALDMPEDTPKESEKVYAYRMVAGTQISGIVCTRRGKGGCIPIRSAMYKVCEEQPEDSILRDTVKWVNWVKEEALKLNLKKPKGK